MNLQNVDARCPKWASFAPYCLVFDCLASFEFPRPLRKFVLVFDEESRARLRMPKLSGNLQGACEGLMGEGASTDLSERFKLT